VVILLENYDNVLSLLNKLEHDIESRENGHRMIDRDFPTEYLSKSEHNKYRERKDAVEKKFGDNWIKHLRMLDELCKQIRITQPKLRDLTKRHINIGTNFPSRLVLGQAQIEYQNFSIVLPKEVDFPFAKAVYIDDTTNVSEMHQLLLRLMFTVPAGKLEINVFDPNGLGKSISVFNALLKNGKIFPDKKILTNSEDLKAVLKQSVVYIQNLRQNYFTLENRNWSALNKYYRNTKSDSYKYLLPYKVFIFFDVPEIFNSEDIRSFRIIAEHGRDCGILLLFSFSQDNINLPEHERNNVIKETKRIISDYSVPLTEIMTKGSEVSEFKYISVKETGDKMPERDVLSGLLDNLGECLKNLSDTSSAFENIIETPELFTEKSERLISAPLGMGDNGEYARFVLGDETGVHHTLVGGISGSGKSNLIHILILSLCSRYSPDELSFYLLDFKEGVEFNVYANPVKLPQARLVATEADVEYGVTVLEYLKKELERRGTLVKESGVMDFKGYRKSNPNEKLPRILLVMDEFQVLFAGTGKLGERAKILMTDLAKRGRSFGIHLLLATQTLHGVDVDSTQFLCRIALKCREEDSRLLLGQNNASASQLKIPQAIINNDAGSVTGNVLFSVPYADPAKGLVKMTINKINREWLRKGRSIDTKVYNGQFLRPMPLKREFKRISSAGASLLLGEVMNFDADEFVVNLANRSGNNLVICGDDDSLRDGLLSAVLKSLDVSDRIDEIIYVGEKPPAGTGKLSIKERMSDSDLIAIKDTLSDRKRAIILDNINFARESGWQFGPPQKVTCPLAYFFLELLETGTKNGSFVIVFAEKLRGFIEYYKPFISHFEKRIGFSLAREDVSMLVTGSAGYVSIIPDAVMKPKRAFFSEDGIIKTWFKPYAEGNDE
jgi:hypothetical protein